MLDNILLRTRNRRQVNKFQQYYSYHIIPGIVNWFLSLPIFTILSKLSYTMYLVHFTVIYVNVFQIRSPIWFSNYDMVSAWHSLEKLKLNGKRS